MREWQCQREGSCCTKPVAVVMTRQEFDLLSALPQAAGKALVVDEADGMVALKAQPCPFYDRGCTVYESRPFNCRRFQCGRWDTSREPYVSDPMPIIRANNDLRWSYTQNQRAHQPWAAEHGWRQ